MVELTTATGRAGVKGCLEAAASPDNIPTYAGLGVGLIGGNIVAKELEKIYTNKVVGDGNEPNSAIQLGIRSIGRLLTSATLCAVSGSFEGKIREGMESAAMGSAGMILVDGIKTYGGETLGNYADLQGVPSRRFVVPNTTRVRPVALQGRPAMESAALVSRPGNSNRPTMETAALTGNASLY